MARPKPIAVSYDPEVDDANLSPSIPGAFNDADDPLRARAMPEAHVTRAVQMIALGLWLGGQAATAMIYSTTLSVTATYGLYAPAARAQIGASYALLPMIAGELALMSAVCAALLLLTTLREGYYARRSPLVSYLPCAATVIGLALIVTANHMQFAGYTSGFRDIADLLHRMVLLTYAQIGLLCCVAVSLAWLQNAPRKKSGSI